MKIAAWWKKSTGLSTNQAIYSALSMTMYRYIVHDSSTSQKESLKCIFEFSPLLIMELIKGLNPSQAILCTFPVEMHF